MACRKVTAFKLLQFQNMYKDLKNYTWGGSPHYRLSSTAVENSACLRLVLKKQQPLRKAIFIHPLCCRLYTICSGLQEFLFMKAKENPCLSICFYTPPARTSTCSSRISYCKKPPCQADHLHGSLHVRSLQPAMFREERSCSTPSMM